MLVIFYVLTWWLHGFVQFTLIYHVIHFDLCTSQYIRYISIKSFLKCNQERKLFKEKYI